jgi:hypothetical protein
LEVAWVKVMEGVLGQKKVPTLGVVWWTARVWVPSMGVVSELQKVGSSASALGPAMA